MRTYEVTEVEREDWEKLKRMSPKEALAVLDSNLLYGYLGSYSYESTDVYHYEKAKLYYAISKVCHELQRLLEEKEK